MADMIPCSEAEELSALAVLGALDAPARVQLDQHLATCAACRETAHAYQRAAALLPDALEPATPSRELRRRVLAAVYGADAPQRRAWSLRSLWERLPASRAFTLAAGAAMVAAVVLGVWGSTRGPATPAAERFTVAPVANDARVQGQLIYYPSSARAVLTVSGIAAPGTTAGASRVYEVWLIPLGGGAPQPAAYLTPVPDSATWTAVLSGDLASYRVVAATLEPPGGRPRPTGPQVFSVALTS